MNRNWTGKLQVFAYTFRLYFLKEIVLAHFQNLFGKSSREYSEKMKAKCVNEDVRKSRFC